MHPFRVKLLNLNGIIQSFPSMVWHLFLLVKGKSSGTNLSSVPGAILSSVSLGSALGSFEEMGQSGLQCPQWPPLFKCSLVSGST